MFTTAAELHEFKKCITRVLNERNGALELDDFCAFFRKVTGQRINRWFKQVRKGYDVPKTLQLLQEYCNDVLEVDTITGQNPIIKVRQDNDTGTFQDHLKTMSNRQSEDELKRSVSHMQGTSKHLALSVDDDDDVTVTKPDPPVSSEQNEEQMVLDQVEQFKLYRDFQMIHITYVKIRIVSMYNNYGDSIIPISKFIKLFKSMYCENFFSRNILKHFVSDGTFQVEDIVSSFISRFCTEFLFINPDMTIKLTLTIPTAHVKFLNQLITALETLATPGYAVERLEPTPTEMMMLGNTVNTDGGINTKFVRNRQHEHSFINFPNQSDFFSNVERPSLSEVNERVNQIRNRICREGRCVKLPEVLQELCFFYKVSCVGELHPSGSREIRREGDIPAVHDLIFSQGKVNAFIQAFVEFRNVCTLHELEEEICKMDGKATFAELKLGPLQKQLLVYEFFKFPPGKDTIPPITTLEVFRLLWKCQSEMHHNNRRSTGNTGESSKDRLTLHQFMEFFIKQHGFDDPFESGVRINSIGLAISVVRKAWFGDMHNIRTCVQKFTKQLCDDFDQHLNHARTNIIGGKNSPDSTRENLVQRISGMNLLEAFEEMYSMLQKMKREACKTLPGTAHLVNFSDITMNALTVIQKDELMRRIFHVLLSTAPLKVLEKDDFMVLHYLGFKPVIDKMTKEVVATSGTGKEEEKKEKKPVTSKALLTKTLKKWLSKNPELNLDVLSNIEYQVTREIGDYDSFEDMGHNSFLQFVKSEKQFKDFIETSLTGDSANSMQIISKKQANDFVKQCCDGANIEDVKKALSCQFNVKQVDGALCSQFMTDSIESKLSNSNIVYQHAYLCGSDIHEKGAVSDVKFYTELAMKRMSLAPYLVNIKDWTKWNLLFFPKLGTLEDFLQNTTQQKSDFYFMATSGKNLIKVPLESRYDYLLRSLKVRDASKTASYILSILLSSGHIKDAPIALLANHVQKSLLEHAGKSNAPSGKTLKFCLDIFVLFPFEILCCVCRKLFISPLNEVFGSLKVPDLLLNASQPNSNQRSILHLLGFHLDIEEWKKDYENELKRLSVNKEEVIPIEDVASSTKKPVLCIDIEKESKKKSNKETLIVIDSEHKPDSRQEPIKRNVVPICEIDTPESEMLIDRAGSFKDFSEPCSDFHVEVLLDAEPVAVVEETDEKIVLAVVKGLLDEVTGVQLVENILDPKMKRIQYCNNFVDRIRREQFGVGLKFGPEEEKLIEILRERQGRSLYRLSQELYTKDSHFVLELIQNADDNEYVLDEKSEEKPTIAFIVEEDKITILNNEKGFGEENIKALCDVGKSTKSIHRTGYIGQKGIGFKSVFRVTDTPQIHSNGFHINFDAKGGANGYICPNWIERWSDFEDSNYQLSGLEDKFTWTTKIVLPLKTEVKHSKLSSRFHDIHPSLLMFLNRLHTIIIDDRVSDTFKVMSKEYKNENMVQLRHNEETSLWLVVNKDVPIDVREGISNTGISVAFPVQFGDEGVKMEDLPTQPVFAFLPLRSYGFKFIIQADFEVPSSREDIDKDSSWNQCVLSHIPSVVVDAFHSFKNHSHFTGFEGVINFFKFMDVEGHVLGIFKQVGRNMIKSLQRENCIPVEVTSATVARRNKEEVNWMVPSSVIVAKPKNKEVVRPEMLKEHIGLYYVHNDFQKKIPTHTLKALGVSNMQFDQLVEIVKAMIRHFREKETVSNKDVEEMHAWLGLWMYIVYKTLQENFDCSQQSIDSLKSLNICALSDGTLASLDKSVVFFPIEARARKGKSVSKELEIIENDLCILSRALVSKLDHIQQQEVKRLLIDIGVKLMTPFDLVHSIIIPLFNTGQWKEKNESLLVAFVTYLHQTLVQDPELFDINDIKGSIALKTNKGFLCPADEVIYFTPSYDNPIDLKKKFPACNWTLLSDEYLNMDFSAMRRKQLVDFFARLGIQSFALLRERKESIHKSDLASSAWEKCSDKWPKTKNDTYIIHDYYCPELSALLKTKQTSQIIGFALELDSRWKDSFVGYKLGDPPSRIVENTEGKQIALTYSSFTLEMRQSLWLPSSTSKTILHKPSDLYLDLPKISKFLGNKVNYLLERIQDKKFITTLGVVTDLTFDSFISAFMQWRKDKLFKTRFQHVVNIYQYFKSNYVEHKDEIKPLFEDEFIFLLLAHCNQRLSQDSVAEGKFFKTKDLIWEDPSGIFVKGEHDNHRRLLKGFYPEEMRSFFVDTVGIDRYPSTKEYLNLIFNISSKTTLPDKKACHQICKLFSIIGETCILENHKDDVTMNYYFPEKFEERVTLYNDLANVLQPSFVKRLQSDDICDEKIFPTINNTFASLSQKPYLAFNDDITPIFKKEDNIVIISMDNIVKMLKVETDKNAKHRRAEENEHVRNVIWCLCLFKSCGIQLLSEVYIPPEVITIGLSRGCQKWEQILYETAPFMQKFLAAKLPSVYELLKTSNFEEYLRKSVFFTVDNLEVIYRLKNRTDVNVKQLKVSNVEEGDGKANIFITSKHVEEKNQYENILSELMTLFVGKVEEYKDLLLDFALVTNKHNYLGRKGIKSLPVGDKVWSYPKPEVIPPPQPKDVPSSLPSLSSKVKDGEQKMTHWPPRDPGKTGASIKPESVRQDEEAMLKKWKQPESPIVEGKPKKAAPSTPSTLSSSSSTTSLTKPSSQPKPHGSNTHDAGKTPTSTTSTGSTDQSAEPMEESVTEETSCDANVEQEKTGTSVVAKSSNQRVNEKSLGQTQVEGCETATSVTSPSMKRKREPSGGMEHGEGAGGEGSSKTDCEGHVKPKPKKTCSEPKTRAAPDYSAPTTKNLPHPNRFDPTNTAFDGLVLEAEYEDLAYHGNEDLEEGELPVTIQKGEVSEDQMKLGHLGEEIVYKHLCKVYKEQIASGSVKVDWLNNDGESAYPYDLKVTFADSSKSLPIYVEVKTTVNDERREFFISSQQLRFAYAEGTCFHLYRVSNVYREKNVKIKRLVNLGSYMDRKAVKLYMIV